MDMNMTYKSSIWKYIFFCVQLLIPVLTFLVSMKCTPQSGSIKKMVMYLIFLCMHR
jgi:hypothetical protein